MTFYLCSLFSSVKKRKPKYKFVVITKYPVPFELKPKCPVVQLNSAAKVN